MINELQTPRQDSAHRADSNADSGLAAFTAGHRAMPQQRTPFGRFLLSAVSALALLIPHQGQADPLPLIDLGTLGFDLSYATAVNPSGVVIGTLYGAQGTHGFVWDAVNGMRDLGTLGGSHSNAVAINSAGQVTGTSSLAGNTDFRAFIWDAASGMRALAPLGTNNQAIAINDAGQVLGRSFVSGAWRGVFWDEAGTLFEIGAEGTAMNASGQVIGRYYPAPGLVRGFIWDKVSGFRDLGNLGDPYCEPRSINDAGQVVGLSIRTAGGPVQTRSFIWDAVNGIRDMGTLGGTFTRAVALNAAGQVAGRSSIGATLPSFIWDQTNGMQSIGTLGGNYSFPLTMNQAGQVLGVSSVVGSTIEHSFLWDAVNGMRDLGATIDDDGSYGPFLLNDAGQVIGIAYTPGAGTRTFAWDENNGMMEIGTLGGNPSYTSIRALNNAGVAVGYAQSGPGGDTHAVVLHLPGLGPDVSNAQPSSGTLWPPNDKLVTVSIQGIDPAAGTTVHVTGVTQDEPTSGGAAGKKAPDAIINANGTVQLRAERLGSGNGRVYHIHFTATSTGGAASGMVTVGVPHNGNSSAVDDGELYDSLQ